MYDDFERNRSFSFVVERILYLIFNFYKIQNVYNNVFLFLRYFESYIYTHGAHK